MTTNTLTNLLPDAYEALDLVSRELTGLIPAVTLDSSANMAAQGQNVRVPITPEANSLVAITPAMAVPSEADQTFTNVALTIDQLYYSPFSWSGEEQYGMNKGVGFNNLRVGQIAQAIRKLTNQVELDLAGLHTKFSRAAGAVGTAPFATTTAAITAARKVLVDNGAPMDDASLVLNTTAGMDYRTLVNVNSTRVTDQTVGSQGIIQRVSDLNIRESAQIINSTAGTAASATSTSAAFTVGQTAIPLATAGTGIFAAGDVITFANDTNQYVITTVVQAGANPASGDIITIAAPGLRKAQGVATRAITVIAASARHMAFTRNSIVLATRVPMIPEGGDMRTASEIITDPRTGLSFELSQWPGQRKVVYQVALCWGYKVIKPEHTALLIGPVSA
jgi:hypothetical protein